MDVEENYSSVSLSFTYIKYNLYILTNTSLEEIGHERWIGSNDSELGLRAVAYEHGNDNPESKNAGNFVTRLATATSPRREVII